jgi:ketosteroid isomerase-like protein
MTHPNAEVVQKLFQAYESGDGVMLDELFADDVTLHMPGKGPLAGTFQGKAQVLGWFEQMGAAAGESFRAEIHSITGDDDHGVALVTESGQKNGKNYEWREVDVFHVRDGKITEGWILIDDLYAADEFFG